MSQLISTRESATKVKIKESYDRKAKPRELEIVSMVLMHVPGLVGKLDDSWNGSFEATDNSPA